MNYKIITTNDEIYHHGIKGQKWGIRRYQNLDGSYTQAGLKRYHEEVDKYNEARVNYKNSKKSYKISKSIADKEAYKNYSKDIKTHRKNANAVYKDLKKAKLADEGKKYLEESNALKRSAKSAATSVTQMSGIVANRVGNIINQNGNHPIAGFILGVGGAATFGGATVTKEQIRDQERAIKVYKKYAKLHPEVK